MHGANADIGVTSEHSIRSTHRYENRTGTKQKPTETTRSTLPTRSPQQSPTSPSDVGSSRLRPHKDLRRRCGGSSGVRGGGSAASAVGGAAQRAARDEERSDAEHRQHDDGEGGRLGLGANVGGGDERCVANKAEPREEDLEPLEAHVAAEDERDADTSHRAKKVPRVRDAGVAPDPEDGHIGRDEHKNDDKAQPPCWHLAPVEREERQLREHDRVDGATRASHARLWINDAVQRRAEHAARVDEEKDVRDALGQLEEDPRDNEADDVVPQVLLVDVRDRRGKAGPPRAIVARAVRPAVVVAREVDGDAGHRHSHRHRREPAQQRRLSNVGPVGGAAPRRFRALTRSAKSHGP
eukprot:CAMPEP_0119353706 /NCGR_PEP_ID=MMETSP1334-20130426/2811_1 /TAXON_ID=127549 /ORGANISM="Calcidiscus leptoporus, Strain RCC1130" /LENGTH=352 /DNA_ID=CAMNT_0007367055 /DNA_START=403 /DNA_END=1461 /DNA_ORIENTATION=+